jgi:hypothetical protein
MRVFAAFFVVLLSTGLAFGQGADYYAPFTAAKPKPKPAPGAGTPAAPRAATPAAPKPAAPKPAARPAAAPNAPTPRTATPAPLPAVPPATTGSTNNATPAPAKQSVRDSYNAFTLNERISLQSDLAWTGHYNGLINGEFSDALVAAVKAFQKRIKAKDTGVLNPQERAALNAAARPRQNEVGWRLIEDAATGARVGLPGKLAPESGPGESGTRWTSAQGQLQIETFRLRGTTLEAAFEEQKKLPVRRRIVQNVMRDGFFILSGMQGLKKFYVRASAKDGEVRGITILYDQAMEGTMDSVVVAMSSAFVPFPAVATPAVAAPAGPLPRRKVEYGTGLVVNASGFIVTDKQMIDDCHVIVIPGHGNAERVAEERGGDLALIRIYGSRDLSPIGLIGATQLGDTVTLVGIADPQAQGGERAVSTMATRLGPAASLRPIETTPSLGFSGAAAINAQGRFAGMVVLKASVVAGPSPGPQAIVVPRERVMNFLDANYVAPASGRPGVDEAKASVLRVICVRK